MNHRNYIRTGLLVLCLCFITFGVVVKAGIASAAEDPIVMLKGVVNRLMAVLRDNEGELRSNPSSIYPIVNKYILPYVDFDEMAKWVVGRNAWTGADPGTRKIFVQEFRTMVINSYAKSLLAYTDQTVQFLPGRNANQEGRVQVSSIITDGSKPIRIDYRMVQEGGSWRVYDIIIEGVSMMQGYRSQFANDLNEGGLEAVIETLQKHNSRGRRQQ